MSIELKEAAQQALKELGEARKIVRASSSRQLAKDWDRRATDALANLRTAIQQAQQPATGEPAGWVLMPRELTPDEAMKGQGALLDMCWDATTCFVARYAELIRATEPRRAAIQQARTPNDPREPAKATQPDITH